MSDYEDEFMCDEDEDYDLEYSEDSNSEPDVDLENQYYNSKVRIWTVPKNVILVHVWYTYRAIKLSSINNLHYRH